MNLLKLKTIKCCGLLGCKVIHNYFFNKELLRIEKRDFEYNNLLSSADVRINRYGEYQFIKPLVNEEFKKYYCALNKLNLLTFNDFDRRF